jgi:3-isopropylmalate/(R)-2-methylmalate dehydratase small subunit
VNPFKRHSGIAVPIDIANCDTDQIIPARFLRHMPDDGGYEKFLFHDLRYDNEGNERSGFILNQGPFRDAKIIVADVNWGCGSSRENAVDALVACGIRCVVAPSFGDIHYNNCMKHGVLPVRLPVAVCDALRLALHESPGAELHIDLTEQTVTYGNGERHTFEIGEFDRYRMLGGLDDIAVTLEHQADIDQFEARHATAQNWL